jgi:beta-mannanase
VRRLPVLLALVIALLAAAACAGPKSQSGNGTGAAGTPPSASTSSAASTPTAGDGQPRAQTQTKSERLLLGAFLDLSGQSSTASSVAQRERAMGRDYDLELTYYDWTDAFPDAGEAAMAADGTAPVMAWYPPDKNPGSSSSLSQITSGADDAWITTQAQAIKAFGHKVYLRLMPEMNGNWYGYSGDPAAFVAAWRHVYDVFARAGAANVVWVWCPNVTPSNWDAYYPGNAYVDVIGVDGFSNPEYTWQTFQQMFGGFFAHFAKFAPGKPQLVVETGTDSGAGVPAAGVGSAASYINGMRSYLEQVAAPDYGVIGVCWFDTDTNNGYNWRVDQTSQAWQAWLAMARDPEFGGKG